MIRVTVYSTATCPICEVTKANLKKWKIPYRERRVDQDREALKEMLNVTRHARTVPQIIIDDRWIGGFDELTELHMEGTLDPLMDDGDPQP